MQLDVNNQLPDLKRWEQAAVGTLWDYLGYKVESVSQQAVIVSLDIQSHHLNMIGILHGGVHAAMIDSAMGMIAMLARPEADCVTVNLNMNYVAPIKQGRVLVTAHIVHQSRKMITTQAYARKENGELLSMGTGTFRVIDRSTSGS